MASVFFSYSHADEALRDQLGIHLSALRRQGVITSWHDRRIIAGASIANEIDSHLLKADIVLLLISPDFLASDYCYEREMMKALDRAKDGEARVVPVILRPCDWKDLPFGQFLAVPTDGRPITKWPNTDEAFLNVVESLKRVIASIPQPSEAVPGRIERIEGVDSTPIVNRPRSSNLQVRKQFKEYDLDAFRNDGFEYVSKFFEGSLEELVKREMNLQQKFRKIDAETFTAAIYQAGEKMCQCTIRLANTFGSRGLEYSSSDSTRHGGVNEVMVVESDDQRIYYRPMMGMQGRRSEKLTPEGAAEYFWDTFFAPLKADDRSFE